MPRPWTLAIHTNKWHPEIERELTAYVTGLDAQDLGGTIAACVLRFHNETDRRIKMVRELEDLFKLREIINDDDRGEPDYCGRAYDEDEPRCCRDDAQAVILFLSREPTPEELAFLEARIQAFPAAYREIRASGHDLGPTERRSVRDFTVKGICVSDGRKWRRHYTDPKPQPAQAAPRTAAKRKRS